ncbi:hypothetical protein BD310DRAFT_341725 [Dichomitus squalens]|uniref:Uncharacterized protein n=1 Tax=Dichomitus squalens TaxID=114155 RepID=A0A4Q9Q077_9APHY|nr:hypothetical protein BD310DRAFT_341725 [Dichomitus squalens]
MCLTIGLLSTLCGRSRSMLHSSSQNSPLEPALCRAACTVKYASYVTSPSLRPKRQRRPLVIRMSSYFVPRTHSKAAHRIRLAALVPLGGEQRRPPAGLCG